MPAQAHTVIMKTFCDSNYSYRTRRFALANFCVFFFFFFFGGGGGGGKGGEGGRPRVGAVVRVLTFHQCGQGLIPGIDVHTSVDCCWFLFLLQGLSFFLPSTKTNTSLNLALALKIMLML